MKPLLEEVLRLQPAWTHINTPDMQRRGQLIRSEIPAWLEPHLPALSAAMGPCGHDLELEGRDGTGPKSEIPWVRFYSMSRSPSAHEGWYCVYLFRATGTGAYLCLGHGSTRYENGEFKPRSAPELTGLIHWARGVLGTNVDAAAGISTEISLEARGELGRAYELGTVCSVLYDVGAVPDADDLLRDAIKFASLLSKLYDAEDLGRSPESALLLAQNAQEAIETLAAPLKVRRGNGQGFGLTHAERSAVDRRAMVVAQDYLGAAGYAVEDVSKKQSFDFTATKDGHEIIVEVKGTTGAIGSIILTANEVAAHQQKHPANALIVVHSIDLNRTTSPPRATGGNPHIISPWNIDGSALKPLSFQYTLT